MLLVRRRPTRNSVLLVLPVLLVLLRRLAGSGAATAAGAPGGSSLPRVAAIGNQEAEAAGANGGSQQAHGGQPGGRRPGCARRAGAAARSRAGQRAGGEGGDSSAPSPQQRTSRRRRFVGRGARRPPLWERCGARLATAGRSGHGRPWRVRVRALLSFDGPITRSGQVQVRSPFAHANQKPLLCSQTSLPIRTLAALPASLVNPPAAVRTLQPRLPVRRCDFASAHDAAVRSLPTSPRPCGSPPAPAESAPAKRAAPSPSLQPSSATRPPTLLRFHARLPLPSIAAYSFVIISECPPPLLPRPPRP